MFSSISFSLILSVKIQIFASNVFIYIKSITPDIANHYIENKKKEKQLILDEIDIGHIENSLMKIETINMQAESKIFKEVESLRYSLKNLEIEIAKRTEELRKVKKNERELLVQIELLRNNSYNPQADIDVLSKSNLINLLFRRKRMILYRRM